MPDGLVAAFDVLVADAPESIALVADGRTVTPAPGGGRARRVAWHLTTEGRLEPGDRVVIALGSDPELFEVLYATLLLGCVPVVVGATADDFVTHSVVDRSDAKVVVHQPARAKAVRAAVKRIPKRWRPVLVEVGNDGRLIDGAPPSREWNPDGASSEGMLLLSIGAQEPGVMLAWNDAELVGALRASTDKALHDARVLPLAPVAEAPGLVVALRALLAGAAIILAGDVDLRDATEVLNLAAREEVEVLAVERGAALQSLAAAASTSRAVLALSHLRAILSTSRVRPDSRRAISDALPGVELREPSGAPRRVDDRLRVIEPDTGRDVSAGSGAVGVVVVGGSVPLGYFGDPERTAASFCSIDGVRYAMTGERASVDEAGIIHLVVEPVADDGMQLRVHVGEVERRLRKHPSVAECVVVDVAVADRGAVRVGIVALVQVTDGHYLDEPELAAWCRSRLGRLAPPERFAIVESLGAEVCDPDDREPARRLARSLLGP